MGKWSDIYSNLVKDYQHVKVNPPATQEQISEVEERLGNKLPFDLRELLLEVNGDSWLIFSTEQIIEINLSVRSLDFYMPLDCLLFFGGNGCGDYYGFPITRSDGVKNDDVFLWEHEDDSRTWKASALEDTIFKYYDNEL